MTERLLAALLACVIGGWASEVNAQSEYEPLQPLPLGSVLLSLPSPHVAESGSYEVRFNHRFGEASGDNTLFGLDAGASVGMAIAWVPRRDLELTLLRTNVLDTVELSGKYVVMQEAAAIPISLSVRAGADWRSEQNVEDQTSAFVQAVLGRRIGSRVELFALPGWVSDAGREPTDQGSVALFEQAFNVPVAIAVHFGAGLTALAEVVPPNRDLPDDADLGWAFGIKKAIGGHHFEILVTNNPGTTIDQYTTSTFQSDPLDRGDIHLGFNIERQFGGRRR